MGIGNSRLPWGKVTSTPQAPKPKEQLQNYEDYELIQLRRTIANNPEMFVLNNLMMCIQFFENYEE